MEICGTPVKKSFGKPYKTSKTSDWSINVIINGKNKKPKITKEFKTKIEADDYTAEFNNKWFVDISDGNHFLRSETFDTELQAKTFVKEKIAKDTTKVRNRQELVLEEETTFLEKKVNEAGGSQVPATTDDIDPEILEQLAKHKEEFDGSLQAAEADAKSLLMSVAKLYLDENVIADSDYIKFKMVIEQKGLSSLVFQLDIARKALFRLSEQIHNGSHSARNYEVLTQLQRIVLDVTKYQHEYLDDIEESMKKLSDDYDTGRTKTTGETIVSDEDGNEVKIVGTNSRASLIDEINEIIDESKKTKTPQSVNKNLHIDADDMTDAIKIKTDDDVAGTSDEDEDITELGLNTF